MLPLIAVRKHSVCAALPATVLVFLRSCGVGQKEGGKELPELAIDDSRLEDQGEKRAEPNSNDSEKKKQSHDKFGEIIGQSDTMQEVFNLVQNVVNSDSTILINGETGTGKGLIAKAIHKYSNRKTKPFISINCGAIPENLLESELFGHVKGAFTDAREDRAGRFEIASGGTLFLDEICNLPLTLQAKLLTVLENRKVIRLGSNKPVPIDVRLVCATNMPIHEMIAENKFRQDLLYRVNTVEISMPPLKERPEDIPLLFSHFLKVCCIFISYNHIQHNHIEYYIYISMYK